MLKITMGSHKAARMLKNEVLAELCLEAAGGGYTEHQTRRAMQAQAAILATGKGKIGNLTIEIVGDESCQ
jgi:hypothetical protein